MLKKILNYAVSARGYSHKNKLNVFYQNLSISIFSYGINLFFLTLLMKSKGTVARISVTNK